MSLCLTLCEVHMSLCLREHMNIIIFEFVYLAAYFNYRIRAISSIYVTAHARL